MSQKTRHQTFAHNFTKYELIFKLFTSGLGSKFATNLCLNIPPRLVKNESQKNGVNLK